MLKLLEIGLNSPECVKIVCKVCESVWKSVWECMKLRILNVLTKTAPTIPQTPHTDLKYPYVPKMDIRTHCVHVLYTCIFVGLVSITFFIVLGGLSEIAEIIVGETIEKLIVVVLMIVIVIIKLI